MKLYTLALLATVATVAVAQTPAPKPTDFPKVVSAQLILDSTEATQPGNEWIKPCGPSNHDDACFTQNPAPAPKPAPQIISSHSAPAADFSILGGGTVSNVSLLNMNDLRPPDGCNPYFGHLDVKRNLCKQTIEFIGMGKVSCSKTHKPHGAWTVTCWYKPNVPPSAKEGK